MNWILVFVGPQDVSCLRLSGIHCRCVVLNPLNLSLLQPPIYCTANRLLSSTCAHSVQAPAFSSEVSGHPLKSTSCTDLYLPHQFCLHGSIRLLRLSQWTHWLWLGNAHHYGRLKALTTYLWICYDYYYFFNVFQTAVNRIVEVSFFGHCNSAHFTS